MKKLISFITVGLLVATSAFAQVYNGGPVRVYNPPPSTLLNQNNTWTGSQTFSLDAFAPNFISESTTTATAAGTTTLTATSTRLQIFTGSTTQTVVMPNATTLTVGTQFFINNNSSGIVTVNNNGGTSLFTGGIPAGGYVQFTVLTNSTSNGTWDVHSSGPNTVTWSANGLDMNNALNTTPRVSSGVASATNPVILPQRGTTNTGYSGDSTHLYGVVAGATASTTDATGINIPSGHTYKINGSQISCSNLSNCTSGSWTPVFTSATPPTGVVCSTCTGTYIQIDNQVTITGVVILSNKGSGGSGDIQITGLPFTSSSSIAAGSLLSQFLTYTGTPFVSWVDGSVSYVKFASMASASPFTTSQWSDAANNSQFYFSITYSK